MTIILKGVQESVQGGASPLAAAGGALAASGRVRNVNVPVVPVVLVAATPTYLIGSALQVPNEGLKVGALLRWTFNMTKTAAGVAASTIAVVAGQLGTVADAVVLSFAKSAGVAAIDEGTVTIEARVVSVSATGVVVGKFILTHSAFTGGGHIAASLPSLELLVVSAGFDNTSGSLIFGLVITTGAADVITVNYVDAEAKYV